MPDGWGWRREGSSKGEIRRCESNSKGKGRYKVSCAARKHDSTRRTSTVTNLQATILHLMGIDHTKPTLRYNGIDRRLTDVHGDVIGRSWRDEMKREADKGHEEERRDGPRMNANGRQ